MTPVSTITNIREAAMEYTRLGLPVLPLCPPDHSGMAFSHREACKAPGKAPLLPDWSHKGPPLLEETEGWFKRWPKANVGLLLGDTGTNNLVGIDIDGEAGETLLEEYSKGILPPTWEFNTAHGRRLIYALPDGAESKKKAVKTKDGELAFLAQGQQTVMPPSIHSTGFMYEWTKSPDDYDIEDAPQWLLNIILVQEGNSPEAHAATVGVDDFQKKVGKGERNNHLTKLAGSLIARRNIPKDQIKSFLYMWNDEHCDPPLPKEEIDIMVENLHTSEQLKNAKMTNKNKTKDVLRPTHFAEYFIKKQDRQNVSWRYCVDRGLFYMCDKLKGPWRVVDQVYLQKAVRDSLIEQSVEWDSQKHVTEVVVALKETLADPSNDELFDIGRHPDVDNVYISNGTLNWKTLELRTWSTESYSTIQLPVEWDASVETSETYKYWLDLLEQWLPDEGTRRFLQEYIGYCLIPDCSHRIAVFLFGHGSNGKSLFLDVISKLFEGYISFVPLHWLSSRFESTKLMDKLINVCGDIDSKFMEETSNIKSMISGDPIRAEFKHGKSFHFHPTSRLLFSANQLPRSSDKSEGWYSRWKFVEFPRRFKTDTTFKKDVLTTMGSSEGLSCLLFWAIEGLRRLYDFEEFSVGEIMSKAEQQYRVDNDSVQAFASSALLRIGHTGAETVLVVPSLYGAYKAWCDDQGVRVVSQHEFVRRMGSIDYEKSTRTIRGVSTACFLGVTFSRESIEAGYQEEYDFNEAIRFSGVRRKSTRSSEVDDA